jgi:hypothetical protein
MAHVLSGLAYNRHVGPVVLAVVIGLVTRFAAIGFRELIRFFNFILLERAWAWAEATAPYSRAALPVITGGGWSVVGLLVYFLAPEAKASGGSEGAHRSNRLEHRQRREPGIAPGGATREDAGRLRRGRSTTLIL